MGSHRLNAIDGLRGIAIIAVIFHHAYSSGTQAALASHGIPKFLVGDGWLGVGLFFELSGFVLALPFFTGREFAASAYFARRSRRLLPMFFLVSTVALLMNGWYIEGAFRTYLLTLTTLNTFIPGEFIPRINPPLWSISLELWFSILFPVLLFAMARRAAFALVAILALAMLVRVFGADIRDPEFFAINHVKDSIVGRIDDFAIGIIVARLYAAGVLRGIGSWVPWAGGVLVAGAALGWDAIAMARLSPYPWSAFLHLIASGGFALILAGCLGSDGLLTRLVSTWPLRVIGAMCYSLYCWHYLILPSSGMFSEPFSLRANAIFWTWTLGLSLVTFRLIEFPKLPWRTLFRVPTPPHELAMPAER
jgi:peptidoglycan/LPS O-acetylase OafA/YrhL